MTYTATALRYIIGGLLFIVYKTTLISDTKKTNSAQQNMQQLYILKSECLLLRRLPSQQIYVVHKQERQISAAAQAGYTKVSPKMLQAHRRGK